MSDTTTTFGDVFVAPVQRSLQGADGSFIIPDVAINERHIDRLIITKNPVEQGAPISDHAFKLPASVSLRYGWSDSSGGYEGYVLDVYAVLIALQNSRTPFTLATGKRLYPNMLVEVVEVETDVRSEYALMVEANCEQVIIVQTQTATLPPANAQASPQQTAQPVDAGPQSAAAANPPPVLTPQFISPAGAPPSGFVGA